MSMVALHIRLVLLGGNTLKSLTCTAVVLKRQTAARVTIRDLSRISCAFSTPSNAVLRSSRFKYSRRNCVTGVSIGRWMALDTQEGKGKCEINDNIHSVLLVVRSV